MKNGAVVGVVAGVAGAGAGTYMAVAPVLQGLRAGAVTGLEAGISLATVATILGFSGAAMGIIYNRFGEIS